ncbi:YeiH family protein [Chromobacterium alticapitis]|uniref:YeiH family putative sulfate export transporter n=1 Tax=Chromobacterium alticapitis TaxID=2073169 RepID=A0A2S5DL94_9NEIS|nr:YeiH family putative sulfate export transporter [Chromobacterium alticapitis]POZ63791.1 YeiH family putative sulfate export transporter [Chromobacterium alticapitis]
MNNYRNLIPGLALSLGLAGAAIWAAELPAMKSLGFSALTIAILAGMVIGNTVYRFIAAPSHHGIAFSKQKLLRAGIILFGFKLTFQDIAAVGFSGVLIDALVLTSTFFLAFWLGRKKLGLDEQSVILIGAGSSICGAAAVLATEPVLKAHAEKVAVAVATVVVFGTAAMFLWPLMYEAVRHLGITEFSYGLFAGSTIHEVAQAVAAGKSISDAAMNTAVITKMIRVMMLAPFLIGLSAWLANKRSGGQAQKQPISIPWFAVAFLAVAGLNSFNLLPHALLQQIIALDNLLLAAAMGALGVTTHLSAIRQAGAKPLLLASALFGWLIVGGGLINAGVTTLLH